MARRKRRLASRVRECLRQLLAFLFSNVGVIVLVVAYTIAGAFMFQAIEGASEVERVNNMTRERDNTAQYLWQNVTLRFNPLNETAFKDTLSIELHNYQRKIVGAVKHGWDGGRSNSQWSFSSAFLYSLTVITTIGYGHLSPRTTWGKIITIFYALLGMPLFLLYLANVGALLARWFKCLYALVCLCRGCPGFTRRRITRLRTQIETSEAESIERPEGWRQYNSTVPDNRLPRHPSRYPDQRHQDRFLHERYQYTYPPHLRNPNHRQEIDKNVYSDRYSPYYRSSNYRYGDKRYLDRYELYRNIEHRYIDRRYEAARYGTRFPDPNRNFQRGTEYLRSTSMPQPDAAWGRPHTLPRGWSEPYGYRSYISEESSEFSYVTFDAQTITVPLTVCVSIMVGYIMFGSMIFGMWEQWDQLDGAYFCFISLSSIGFGDFVPGERIYTARIETSFIVCSMYLMLGMALIAMCFNLIQEQVIHYVACLKRTVKRICRCKR